MIVIDVLGTPAPKGSSRAFHRPGMKHAVMAPSGSDINRAKQRSWDAAVRERAVDAVVGLGESAPTGPVFVGKPLAVRLTFRMVRPSGHWSKKPGGRLLPKAPLAPATKPDIDKLTRSTLDSLTGLVFDDDSRIVELVVRKVYAEPGREGARIEVEEWRGFIETVTIDMSPLLDAALAAERAATP